MGLFAGIIMSAFGFGYFIYGKKSDDLQFLFTGIALMIYPYFFQNVMVIVILGVLLLIAPFALKKFTE